MYIGQRGDALNYRFNRHRPDILSYPNRCERPQHFCYCDCSFETDPSVPILEKVKGSECLRKIQRRSMDYVWILFILMV